MAITDPAVIIVNDKYAKSVEMANTAAQRASAATQAFANAIYSPPQISVQWQTLAAPNLPQIPNAPSLPSLNFNVPHGEPGALSASMGNVQIDDFNIAAPTLNFGDMPALNIGTAPTLPNINDVTIPDAPNVVLPDAPQFLQLQTHSFGGVDLHEEWLDKLDEIPVLSVLQPERFSYSPGARYASQLMDNLKAVLNARIQGGTGILPAVEQQIWDRARDRETQIALAREQEVLRGAEALGFPLPSGVLAAQLQDARREYHDKLSGLSRDIAIKQAELEQANLQQATTLALQLESTLLDDCYKLEMLAFETAKTAADNAIAAHNAAIEHFKALGQVAVALLFAREVFEPARSKVVGPEYGSWAHKAVQSGSEGLAAQFHARRGNLHGKVVAVAVNDKAGQKVALAVAKPIPGGGVEALAQGQCRFQPLDKQGLIHICIGLAAVQACADKRSRVDAHAAKRCAAPVAQGGGFAGGKVCKRALLHIHFVGEYPQVTGAQAAVFIFFKAKFAHVLLSRCFGGGGSLGSLGREGVDLLFESIGAGGGSAGKQRARITKGSQ